MPCPCRSPGVALPCRLAKHLDCLSHFNNTARPCFNSHMSCRAPAVSQACRLPNYSSRPRHSTAGARHSMCELAFNNVGQSSVVRVSALVTVQQCTCGRVSGHHFAPSIIGVKTQIPQCGSRHCCFSFSHRVFLSGWLLGRCDPFQFHLSRHDDV